MGTPTSSRSQAPPRRVLFGEGAKSVDVHKELQKLQDDLKKLQGDFNKVVEEKRAAEQQLKSVRSASQKIQKEAEDQVCCKGQKQGQRIKYEKRGF